MLLVVGGRGRLGGVGRGGDEGTWELAVGKSEAVSVRYLN